MVLPDEEAVSALDAEFCAFECGNRATGVREYRNSGASVWLAGCDGCDQKARVDLARAESKFNRQMPSTLADAVLDDEVLLRQQQRASRARRTPEQWEEVRRKGRESAALKRRGWLKEGAQA